MSTYDVADFLILDEILISPDIQKQADHPFTLERAKRFFDYFARESFTIDGEVKSIIINSGRQNLPDNSFASGFLLSETISVLQTRGSFSDKIVGLIRMEYGGDLTSPRISVTKK